MEVLYPRSAGLDVHASSVTACVRIAVDATVTYEHRTVSANTRGLLDLGHWFLHSLVADLRERLLEINPG
jgi:transposase